MTTVPNDFHLAYTHMMAQSSRMAPAAAAAAATTTNGVASSTLPPEEISVLTVDSNSKSNDITVVERTMLTGVTNNTNTHGGGGGGVMNEPGGHSNEGKRHQWSSRTAAQPGYLHTSIGSASSAYNSVSSSFIVSSSSGNSMPASSAKASPWAQAAGNSIDHNNSNQFNPHGSDCVDSGLATNSAHMPTSTPDLAYINRILATRARTTPNSISQYQGKPIFFNTQLYFLHSEI